MSRGLGAEQRWLLDYVAGEPNGRDRDTLPNWTRLADAIALRYLAAPTPAQVEAMRRAARTLAKRGLIELDTTGIYPARDEWRRPGPTRRATFVRRVTTADDWRHALDHARAQMATAPDEMPDDWRDTGWGYWEFAIWRAESELAERLDAAE